MVGKKKKSKAQINRMLKRAEARGESYEIPPEADEPNNKSPNVQGDKSDDVKTAAATSRQEEQVGDDDDVIAVASSGNSNQSTATTKIQDSSSKNKGSNDDGLKRKIAVELKQSLESIANAEALKSKERRSAKRKAEAIAAEKSGCSAEELLSWLENEQNSTATVTMHDKKMVQEDGDGDSKKKKKNPYIVFIGQLSYDTTKESLLAHIQKELEKEVDENGNHYDISADTVSIRLLIDPKTKKSRGMAFVEVQDPQLLYACLKLHLTYLQGRRLNVERTVGGKSNSTSGRKKSKLQELRLEQQNHMQHVVETMLQEHYDNGTIQKGEIDDGVIALCQRHAATVVQAALERYCESHGRDMDNPSAYLTFLLGKLAEEGIFEKKQDMKREVVSGASSSSSLSPRFKRQKNSHESSSSSSARGGGGSNKNNNKRYNGSSGLSTKKEKPTSSSSSSSSSVFARQGIDMSISDTNMAGHEQKDLSSIFPSISSRGGRRKG